MAIRRLNDLPDPGKDRPRTPKRVSDASEPAFSDQPTREPREPRVTRSGKKSRHTGPRKPRASFADRKLAAQERLAKLPREEQVAKAKGLALYALTASPKTRKQLETKLDDKGYAAEIIVEVLERLEELHLIDDASFARNYATSKQRSGGLAENRIRRELSQKGIDRDVMDEALDDLDGLDEDSQYQRALELVRKKTRGTRNLDSAARTRRLAGMLARKGYPSSIAFRAVKEALAEDGDEADGDYDTSMD
jgi:regulatory protein